MLLISINEYECSHVESNWVMGDEGTLYGHEEMSRSSLDLSRDINKPEQFTLLFYFYYFYFLVFTSHVI